MQQDRLRALVNSFPRVAARTEEGSFELAPSTAPAIEPAVWWQVRRGVKANPTEDGFTDKVAFPMA